MVLVYCQNFVFTQYLVNEFMELDQFCLCIDLNKSRLELLHVNLHSFATESWPLIIIRIWNLTKLMDKLMEFNQILLMHLP